VGADDLAPSAQGSRKHADGLRGGYPARQILSGCGRWNRRSKGDHRQTEHKGHRPVAHGSLQRLSRAFHREMLLLLRRKRADGTMAANAARTGSEKFQISMEPNETGLN